MILFQKLFSMYFDNSRWFQTHSSNFWMIWTLSEFFLTFFELFEQIFQFIWVSERLLKQFWTNFEWTFNEFWMNFGIFQKMNMFSLLHNSRRNHNNSRRTTFRTRNISSVTSSKTNIFPFLLPSFVCSTTVKKCCNVQLRVQSYESIMSLLKWKNIH